MRNPGQPIESRPVVRGMSGLIAVATFDIDASDA